MSSSAFSQNPPPEAGRFWLRLISSGVRPGLTFFERKTFYILNSVTLLMGTGGFLFSLTNFLQRNFHLLPWNLGNVLTALCSSLLLRAGRWRAALTVLSIGGTTVVFYQALEFRNGNEILLITFGILLSFLMESTFWRTALIAASGVAYMIIQAAHYDFFQNAAVSQARYLTNIAVGLVTTYIYAMVFRTVSDDYRKTVESKNRELEEQRAALRQANAAKEKLFSIVAHDLRAPVGNLKEALGYLHDGRLSQEDFQPLQKRLKDEVDAVFTSMENLLEWSVGQTGGIVPRMERISLFGPAEEAIQLLQRVAQGKGLILENRIPREAVAWGDGDQIRIVLRNLLSNAVKFTPSGGRIWAEAQGEAAGWRITVGDSGVGMASEKARTLLESADYQTTLGTSNEKGLGLGLKICRDFVAANGGKLEVESAPGKGTLFRFTLPEAKAVSPNG